MSTHRIRARMRFPQQGGLAQQAFAQTEGRFGRAVTIRAGTIAEEPRQRRVERETFVCDLPLPDEEDAEGAYATLAGMLDDSLPVDARTPAGATVPSWVEHHVCFHDEREQIPCVLIKRATGPGGS